MKLWVWTDVLADYTDGIAFALGHSPADARLRLIEKYVEDVCGCYAADSEAHNRAREHALTAAAREFSKEPVEMTAGYCFGGG